MNLPPGPNPITSSLLLLRKPLSEFEAIIRNLQARYGPIISLRIGSRPLIFISSPHLADQALIQNGAVFADRPPPVLTTKITSSNQHNITSAFYGPTWRLLRGNLISEMMNPSRVKSYSGARNWVLHILANRLTEADVGVEGVRVVDHLKYAMFCLMVAMCFGERLDETQIKKIETFQQELLHGTGPSGRFNVLDIWPAFTKIVLKKRWEEFFQLRKDQRDVLLPLIRARKDAKLNSETEVVAYVDTLLDLEFPDEKRKLTEDEILGLCSEFIDAGTDAGFTALQWIIANIVKYPGVQERLVTEIKGVVGETEEEVKEEDLQKMPYLKAVILEGLRRHPPVHFVLPHAVTEDVVLDGYLVPKKGTVNFMVASMGRDPEVWEDPMAFKPERFLSGGEGEGVDITGSREIKMMPFGVGKRMCAGLSLAVLHLEYLVANLVWKFEWRGLEGEEVDLAEKFEFSVVMMDPLKAHISPRVIIKGSGL